MVILGINITGLLTDHPTYENQFYEALSELVLPEGCEVLFQVQPSALSAFLRKKPAWDYGVNSRSLTPSRATYTVVDAAHRKQTDWFVYLQDTCRPVPTMIPALLDGAKALPVFPTEKLIASGSGPCLGSFRPIWTPHAWATSYKGLGWMRAWWCFRNTVDYTASFRQDYGMYQELVPQIPLVEEFPLLPRCPSARKNRMKVPRG